MQCNVIVCIQLDISQTRHDGIRMNKNFNQSEHMSKWITCSINIIIEPSHPKQSDTLSLQVKSIFEVIQHLPNCSRKKLVEFIKHQESKKSETIYFRISHIFFMVVHSNRLVGHRRFIFREQHGRRKNNRYKPHQSEWLHNEGKKVKPKRQRISSVADERVSKKNFSVPPTLLLSSSTVNYANCFLLAVWWAEWKGFWMRATSIERKRQREIPL